MLSPVTPIPSLEADVPCAGLRIRAAPLLGLFCQSPQ
jgi:hypothetical protein